MKRIYWRPLKVSRTVLVVIAIASVAGLMAVETFKTTVRKPYYEEKLAAATLADRAIDVIRQERLRLGYAIDPEIDPGLTGMLGAKITPITSIAGGLSSKQTAVNPNFAAAIVQMLKQAGLKKGDVIAIGYTGSFPTFNLSLCAAIETLQLKPILITSGGSSQYGANLTNLLWMDMERMLLEANCISFRSVAASFGGYEDCGFGMSDEAHRIIRNAANKNDLRWIDCKSLRESVDTRMDIYQTNALGAPIKAYVNVGGGAASTGRALGRKLYSCGLNMEPPTGVLQLDSVMTRFMKQGVPVIHLAKAKQLAKRYGFPFAPTTKPIVGQGELYYNSEYNLWLVCTVLTLILLSLRTFILTDLGYRIVHFAQPRRNLDTQSPIWEERNAELMI